MTSLLCCARVATDRLERMDIDEFDSGNDHLDRDSLRHCHGSDYGDFGYISCPGAVNSVEHIHDMWMKRGL